MTQYTPEQLRYITENDFNLSRNVSFHPNSTLLIDLLLLLEDEGTDYDINNFSAIIREAVKCLLHFGLDWRQVSSNDKLDEILFKLDNLGTVRVEPGVEIEQEKKERKFNDGEFFK